MKEVEDVAKQQMERVIAFPYQILGSAFTPLEHKDRTETAKGSVDLPSDEGPSTTTELKTFEYANTNFSNFDKGNDESCFKVGQVWAAYDTLDAMPRFYAVIR
ncbi:hypothetical protein MTR67_003620 [Solanum verrucosum]|uniref:DUF3444 domain-containing protein n=1 Tax=Solanum verrucosum TaxID=315347 RepID=A0AAF0PUN2_SOLVR|nr:hypothetical protein MTR67_003620 [Solanum verrucosum]